MGKTYRWYVAIIPHPDRRSKDLLAYGEIERVDLEPALGELLKKAAVRDRAGIYAAAGLWYEALDQLTSLIDSDPTSVLYRRQRASLLEQVGLNEVARLDSVTPK